VVHLQCATQQPHHIRLPPEQAARNHYREDLPHQPRQSCPRRAPCRWTNTSLARGKIAGAAFSTRAPACSIRAASAASCSRVSAPASRWRRPRNIAIVENASVAFTQAVASFDLERGDRVVTSRADYVSQQLMLLALKKRLGIEIDIAADLPEGGVDPQSIGDLARHPRCRFVAVCWMPTNSGLIQDVHTVGEVCAHVGVPFVLDACQAVGQVPVEVTTLRCDFLTATARKFMRGPRGIGFLFVSDAALDRGWYPVTLDSQGARWTRPTSFELVPTAQRYENWEFAYALLQHRRRSRSVHRHRSGNRTQ
jgi:selenocysteine lyase/cysteine desulfurase